MSDQSAHADFEGQRHEQHDCPHTKWAPQAAVVCGQQSTFPASETMKGKAEELATLKYQAVELHRP